MELRVAGIKLAVSTNIIENTRKLCAAIEYAADSKAIIVGKPSAEFFHQALLTLDHELPALMVGDDIFGDVQALRRGSQGAVERGVTSAECAAVFTEADATIDSAELSACGDSGEAR